MEVKVTRDGSDVIVASYLNGQGHGLCLASRGDDCIVFWFQNDIKNMSCPLKEIGVARSALRLYSNTNAGSYIKLVIEEMKKINSSLPVEQLLFDD